jgi:membrane-bound serine protease (ClpP class)
VVLARQFGRIPVLNRLVLAPMADGDAAPARDESDGVVKTGDFGMSESPLRPAGKALFGDSYVNVVADGSFIDAGRPIKVVDVSGYRIVVREIEEKPVPAPPSG